MAGEIKRWSKEGTLGSTAPSERLHTHMRTLRSREGRLRVRGSEGPNTEPKSRSLGHPGWSSFLPLRCSGWHYLLSLPRSWSHDKRAEASGAHGPRCTWSISAEDGGAGGDFRLEDRLRTDCFGEEHGDTADPLLMRTPSGRGPTKCAMWSKASGVGSVSVFFHSGL